MTHHQITGTEAFGPKGALVPGYGAIRIGVARSGFWIGRTGALLILMSMAALLLSAALLERFAFPG